jgi:hypothetical protein
VPETTQPGLAKSSSGEHHQKLLLPDWLYCPRAVRQQVMPDDHSESVPPLPIPNRTVKRLHADDSADSRVKVGHRQAPSQHQKPHPEKVGFLRLQRQNHYISESYEFGMVKQALTTSGCSPIIISSLRRGARVAKGGRL